MTQDNFSDSATIHEVSSKAIFGIPNEIKSNDIGTVISVLPEEYNDDDIAKLNQVAHHPFFQDIDIKDTQALIRNDLKNIAHAVHVKIQQNMFDVLSGQKFYCEFSNDQCVVSIECDPGIGQSITKRITFSSHASLRIAERGLTRYEEIFNTLSHPSAWTDPKADSKGNFYRTVCSPYAEIMLGRNEVNDADHIITLYHIHQGRFEKFLQKVDVYVRTEIEKLTKPKKPEAEIAEEQARSARVRQGKIAKQARIIEERRLDFRNLLPFGFSSSIDYGGPKTPHERQQ
ncbi:MAG TPA: hypothetical protein VLE95_01025 [Chlamydiales bacterium]|nr:hypothetical protein [Chlamydiales bacterium]